MKGPTPFGPKGPTPSDEVLAIREFFEWIASEAECDLTPKETRIGLDLIAYRRGVDPETLIARLENARREMDAEDLYSALDREQEAT